MKLPIREELEGLAQMHSSIDTLAILHAAIKLEVFTDIRNGLHTPGEIVKKRGYETNSLESLLNSLVSLEYLSKSNNNEYQLKEKAIIYLEIPESVNLVKLSKVYLDLFNFDKRVRDNKVFYPDDSEWEIITAISSSSTELLINYLSGLLPQIRTDTLKIVDLACGNASHIINLIKQNSKIKATGVEINTSIAENAKKNIREHKFENMAQIENSDMFIHNLGSDNDIVFLFSALRGFDYIKFKQLCEKVFQSLNKGGYLIIHDFFLDNEKIQPMENVLFNLKIVLSSDNGRLLTIKECESIKTIGFRHYQAHFLDNSDYPVPGSSFHIFQK
jgi:precorrin-6B methylase 2